MGQHCRKFRPVAMTRRDMLGQAGLGFGASALVALMNDRSFAGVDSTGRDRSTSLNPLQPRQPHFQPQAKNIIFLYMDGGVSHVDSFDPKAALEKYNGRSPHELMDVQPTQFDNIGKVLKSPWGFRPYGQCGTQVSDLFPKVATCVDDLAVIRSMTSKFSEHTNANYFLHTGSGLQGRPSMGAWTVYGLGSTCQNLPGFVVINGGLTPPGGLDNFNSGFLPASFQGSVFNPKDPAVSNIKASTGTDKQRSKLNLMAELDGASRKRTGMHDKLESAIKNYELAFKMQTAVPELMDLGKETEATKKMYGFDHSFDKTRIFAQECLLARRLVERGVRFVELTCPNCGNDRWDAHNNLKKNHENNARAVDQPIAGLLKDLKKRGLLDETLVVWAGEFGRTPFAQGSNGRDHHPYAYSIWMAGGGIQGGITYGETDEFGFHVIDGRMEMHDLHATMLHALGLDHTKSTFRFSGRDMRLTDVHGHVVHALFA